MARIYPRTSQRIGIMGWLLGAAIFLASLLFLLRFADLDGYEGDDLNSILPMAHLDAAKAGLLLIYRYAWQPLSYELGAWVWKLFGTPDAVFLMAPVAGAIAIALIAICGWREAHGSAALRTLSVLLALLALPELFYSSLYYNSTIVGLPLAAGALLLLLSARGPITACLAGLLAALAVLCRLDFILVAPLLGLAAWPRGESLKRAIVFGVALTAILGISALTGVLDLTDVIRIQASSAAEIAQKSTMPGWDLRTKLFVAAISLAPLGWLLLIAGIALHVLLAWRIGSARPLLWALAALPAFYPLANILSPKYMLPLAPFLVILFARTLSELPTLLPRRKLGLLGSALLIGLAPLFVSAARKPPSIAIGQVPSEPVGTHDGPRAFGGYLPQMIATDAPESRTADQKDADEIASAWLNGPAGDTLFVGGENYFDKGGVGWRHLQLILEKRGINGVLDGPHRLVFTHGPRRLILAKTPSPAVAPGTRLIDRRSEADEP